MWHHLYAALRFLRQQAVVVQDIPHVLTFIHVLRKKLLIEFVQACDCFLATAAQDTLACWCSRTPQRGMGFAQAHDCFSACSTTTVIIALEEMHSSAVLSLLVFFFVTSQLELVE